jgi:DNA-binding winged helix-turn-helix (wHTH) protein
MIFVKHGFPLQAHCRRSLQPDPSAPVLIKTVRGIGYMFATDVKTS